MVYFINTSQKHMHKNITKKSPYINLIVLSQNKLIAIQARTFLFVVSEKKDLMQTLKKLIKFSIFKVYSNA